MDEWDDFWRNLAPGTVFEVGNDLLVFMKPNESHHIENCLFNLTHASIHHYSEYFLYQGGLDKVKECSRVF